MAPPERLVLRAVSKSYGSPPAEVRAVLTSVDLEAEPGTTLAIMGPSGSGKSTLLNLIGSLDRPSSGSILLGEIEVDRLEGPALTQYRAKSIGFVFQDHHLLPQLTAIENVLLPTLAGNTSATPARAAGLLERMGLAGRAGSFPAEMSGGERQRVAVARALIAQPSLLLCDEPTGNLDPETGKDVLELLLLAAAETGATVVLVTHNAEHAARTDRRLVLREGRLEEDP